MEQKHKNVLQTSFNYLIKNLHNVDAICDELLQDNVLTAGMNDSIKHKKPKPTGQTRELLSILPRRGNRAYASFIKALDDTDNKEFADYLREKDGSKRNGKISEISDDDSSNPKRSDNSVIQETTHQYSEKPEETKKLESKNKHTQDWPDLSKPLQTVQQKDIIKCTKESFTMICDSRKVYHMTSKKKGKFLSISNVQCTPQTTEEKSPDDSKSKKCTEEKSPDDSKSTKCTKEKSPDDSNFKKCTEEKSPDDSKSKKCTSCVDFDKTAIFQLFKHVQYESQSTDARRDVSGDDMKKFLDEHLNNTENSTFDSLVVVILSGGVAYKPGEIYDKDGKKIQMEEILEIFRKSTAFKNKPKIIIIRTYSFEEETETSDILDAEKADLHFYKTEPNKDDLFVVSSQPRRKKGPWIIGDHMNGSYFIQAFIHVFKNMAHEQSFMDMMIQVNKCLSSAMMPVGGKQAVAEVMIFEHSKEKDLFFFPGLTDDMIVPPWPDLVTVRNTVRKQDVKLSSLDFYNKISKERKIYPMTNGYKRGKCILISNVHCQNKHDGKKTQRHSQCSSKLDFDLTNIGQLLKFIGYDFDQIKNFTNEKIKEFLKGKLDEIDKNQSSKYDSLCIMFLSGKFDCEAGVIYDCNGKAVQRNAILEIIRGCHHFEGKPKIVFVQTYNFQEKSKGFDSSDSKYDIIKNGKSNTDDVFVVSNYPRIEQGPWILGENMSGSYFIQALIHVFKNFACEKSFMELLKEANMCLAHAVVPTQTTEGNKKVTIERKTVAQIVLLEYCEGAQLYFFPRLDVTPIQKGLENKDVSESGKPVRAESNPQ